MNKFKINREIFESLSVRLRQELKKSNFTLSDHPAPIVRVPRNTTVRDYDFYKLNIGEAYSIFGFVVMPIQTKALRVKKETGMVFTVNERIGIVLRIK